MNTVLLSALILSALVLGAFALSNTAIKTLIIHSLALNKPCITKLCVKKLCIVSILCCLSAVSQAQALGKISFSETEINVPFKITHPILPINISDNAGVELVTFSIDEANKKWLMVYASNHQGLYQEIYRTSVPNHFYSFDYSSQNSKQLQTLYFLSSEGVHGLNAKQITLKASFKKMHNVSSMAVGHSAHYLEQTPFLAQLNNDDFDDIIISGFTETTVLVQTPKGVIRSVLPIAAEAQFSNDTMKYFKMNTFVGDVNLDNLHDVIYVDNGKLHYFEQNNNGTFNPVAKTLEVNALINNTDWWNKLDSDGEKFSQSNLRYRKIEQLKDINNDNIVDMVVQFSKSEGVLSKTNDYEIYLGRHTNNTLQFLNTPDSSVSAEGTLTDLQFVDINNDNKDEILVLGFDIGVSQIISALLAGNIDQDIHLFYMNEASHFNKKAKVSKEVELSFSLRSGSRGVPVTQLLDVNGDKLKDLMISDGNKLRIYLGTSEKRLFSRKSLKHKTRLPERGDMVTTADLNVDGKEDILLKYGREDDNTLRTTFRVIMSQ